MTHEIIQVDEFNVLLVDQIGSNFLCRGPNPVIVNNGECSFDYQGLKDSIRAAVPDVPEHFRLIDINLLQLENANEIPMIKAEKEFFDGAPEAGEFHFWETQGTTVCAMDEVFSSNPSLRDWFALNLDNWLADPLIARIETLHFWLENMPEPTVIFAHCEGGIDRTGELMGAYYLRWKGFSWEEMNSTNEKVANRVFGCNNYRATLWYCLYLVVQFGFELDFTVPQLCFDWDVNPHAHFGCGGPTKG
ncbi:MAG: hypothetical protein QOD75_1226 [Blastocatellia bacterium]|jgi:hypothetical protein|nr:hypothetical protein [Blastocatellia bacterium]